MQNGLIKRITPTSSSVSVSKEINCIVSNLKFCNTIRNVLQLTLPRYHNKCMYSFKISGHHSVLIDINVNDSKSNVVRDVEMLIL